MLVLPKKLLVSAVVLIYGCAPPPKVAVEERTVFTVKQQTERIGGQLIRTVKPGETLHAIAFEYNLDIKQLAAWNQLSDASRLLAGQRIRLTKPIGFIAKSGPRVSVEVSNNTAHSSSVNSKPEQAAPNGNLPPKTTNSSVRESVRNQSLGTNTTLPRESDNTGPITWRWPLKGQVIRRFSPSSTQQGIDILGKNGTDVRASASGEVVYVGNSLKGYGNLIIIKHDETFLSAYAHNQKILVSEGQKIALSQLIGSVGINNRGESALHFQIRLNGKPINPLRYLKTG